MGTFKALGLSYKNTPIKIREKVAFSELESREFLLKLKETFSIEEALLVSTCNRTELYFSTASDNYNKLVGFIASFKGIPSHVIKNYIVYYNSKEASRHLFEVTLGLQSQVLGDIQISNQVKKAYQQSTCLDFVGPHLHRLMHTIFFANKRVVQETSLQDGVASIASVAVDLIKGFIDNISAPKIGLIGLGKIGQNVLENLSNNEVAITLINRTKSKAVKLAEGKNISVCDYTDLYHTISENDIIISAISSTFPILSSKNFNSHTAQHKLLIDLSVPRSMDSDLENIPGISLYNVDHLTERTVKARSIREKAIPYVQQIIDEEMDGFKNWKNEMEISPTIQKLKKALNQIRKEELTRHKKLSDKEIKLLDIVTKNMIQKMIKLPVLHLKAACKRGEADTLMEVLNDLFNLESIESKKK